MTDETVDREISGFTVVPDKTVLRRKRALDALPLWWRRPETVAAEVLGSDSVPVAACECLSARVKQLLADHSIHHLFSVQARVVPAVLHSYRFPFLRPRDVCVCTPTGSGKTLAYVLPVIELLQARERIALRALIVLPSRTLALQVYSVLKSYADPLGLRTAVISGQVSLEVEQKLLVSMDKLGNCRSNVDVLVTTPGRFVDHLANTTGFSMKDLRLLIIDEADLMLAEDCQEWYQALERKLFDIPAADGGRCRYDISVDACLNAWSNRDAVDRPEKSLQKLLFSATLTYNPELEKYFSLWDPQFFSSSTLEDGAALSKPEALDGQVRTAFSAPSGLKELYVCALAKYKPLFLVHLVLALHMDHILVFVNTRASTQRLRLLLAGFDAIRIGEVSAKLAIGKRERLLRQFASGQLQILICTDSISRGMDVENVRCIVSYDAPHSFRDYMHRVGRTARAGTEGVAYTMLFKSQVYGFMKEVKIGGGRKVKEVKFHRSHMKRYLPTYEIALKQLHSTLKG